MLFIERGSCTQYEVAVESLYIRYRTDQYSL